MEWNGVEWSRMEWSGGCMIRVEVKKENIGNKEKGVCIHVHANR